MLELIPIQIRIRWELFVLSKPVQPFALPFLLALAPTGWLSLTEVGRLCLACAASIFADWQRGYFTHSPMSVREGNM